MYMIHHMSLIEVSNKRRALLKIESYLETTFTWLWLIVLSKRNLLVLSIWGQRKCLILFLYRIVTFSPNFAINNCHCCSSWIVHSETQNVRFLTLCHVFPAISKNDSSCSRVVTAGVTDFYISSLHSSPFKFSHASKQTSHMGGVGSSRGSHDLEHMKSMT